MYVERHTVSSIFCGVRNIFCMSFDTHGLAGTGETYTLAVIDVSLVRQVLKLLRKRNFSSNRHAARAAHVDPSTVAKIENMKRWPKYDPGIGIILRLLQAMKMTLPEFANSLHEADVVFEMEKTVAAEGVAGRDLPSQVTYVPSPNREVIDAAPTRIQQSTSDLPRQLEEYKARLEKIEAVAARLLLEASRKNNAAGTARSRNRRRTRKAS